MVLPQPVSTLVLEREYVLGNGHRGRITMGHKRSRTGIYGTGVPYIYRGSGQPPKEADKADGQEES